MSALSRETRLHQVEAIKRVVAETFGLSDADLSQATMKRDVAIPRQIAMYLVKHLTDATAVEIGQCFGKHYTTVIHAVSKIAIERQHDTAMDAMVDKLLRDLSH